MCMYQFIFNIEHDDNDLRNMVSIILTYISVRFIIEFDLTPGYSARHNFCADIVRWCLLNLPGNTRFTAREKWFAGTYLAAACCTSGHHSRISRERTVQTETPEPTSAKSEVFEDCPVKPE